MQLPRRQIYAYVAIAAVVLAVGVRYVVLPKAAGPAGGEPLVLAPASPPPASPAVAASPSAAADVVVYVCGAVKSPGVVRVPAGARVADALALAGGPVAKAELDGVNLAAKVVDGQQIMVPERAATVAAGSSAGTGSSAASGSSDPMAIPLEPFERQFRDFGEAIVQGRKPLVSGEEGYRALEVVDAIYRSCRTGEKALLPGRS